MCPRAALGVRVVLPLLVAAAVLAGRFELAVHPYEHHAGEPTPDCDRCEFAQVAAGAPADGGPVPEAWLARAAAPRPAAAVRPIRRRTHLPRAPPSLT